jgi:hypothetical protein
MESLGGFCMAFGDKISSFVVVRVRGVTKFFMLKLISKRARDGKSSQSLVKLRSGFVKLKLTTRIGRGTTLCFVFTLYGITHFYVEDGNDLSIIS